MQTLLEKIEGNYGKHQYYSEEEKTLYGEESFNCCEKILRGANSVYSLGLDAGAERVSAAFGGGMGIQTVCGAVCGALMSIGVKCCKNIEKNSDTKKFSVALLERVEKELGSIYCSSLKPKYFVDDDIVRCDAVITAVAKILDETMAEINQTRKDEVK